MSDVVREGNGNAHISWELTGVTAEMLDWSWSNLDKTYFLWHPSDHVGFCWAVPVTPDSFIGAVHKTLQGERAKQFKRAEESPVGLSFFDVALMPPELARYVEMEHAVLVGPVFGDDYGKPSALDPHVSYRLHQWSASDRGVVGKTSAITPSPTDVEAEIARTEAWIPHAMGEVKNWAVFLPELYRLYQVIDNPVVNPFHDLRVKHIGHRVEYIGCK